MDPKNIAVVGATGAVGREMVRILEERALPIASFRPVASARSAGKTVQFKGEDVPVTVLDERALDGIDIAIWDTPDDVSLEWVPKFRDRVINIDKSSTFRMRDDVPLVIPEINGDTVKKHKGIIANPNCTMTTLIMPLAPLHRAFTAKRVVCSSYQSVSGAGVAGVEDLYEQLEKWMPERDAVRNGTVDAPPGRAFHHPIAFNVIPHVGGFDDAGRTSEERRIVGETQKILDAKMDIFATCVRVPTVAGHGISAWVEFEQQIDSTKARAVLQNAAGVAIEDDPSSFRYPTALQAAGGDTALVGRLRDDPENTRALGFFSSCDNLRKGAALNAVQIVELLLAQ
ncbi:MAG: aspartate-semialdehyde dehydrogenase [Actinomycetota bacterium]